jgi:hypothetical protein
MVDEEQVKFVRFGVENEFRITSARFTSSKSNVTIA